MGGGANQPGTSLALCKDVIRRAHQIRHERASRVLLVEDDPLYRWLIGRLLEHHGYWCIEAAHGREGYKVAQAWPPHVLLTGLSMPFMDGLALIQAVRTTPSTEHIPILLLSDESEPADHRADLFLSKQVAQGSLLKAIARLVGGVRPTRSAPSSYG